VTVAVIFSSTLSADSDGYEATANAMDTLARQQPGFVGIESVRGADGFGITVSYWVDDAAARAWKGVAEHVEAQRLGMQHWYLDYRVVVAEVTREYRGQ
jgi:heme-degrading monooxygenase HmoA